MNPSNNKYREILLKKHNRNLEDCHYALRDELNGAYTIYKSRTGFEVNRCVPAMQVFKFAKTYKVYVFHQFQGVML